ncbi:DUF1214 domain-containing protein [Salipiger sp. CCB-MM3]|uniref:DUF1214 domain-containing protein n=1 Tax=Salipiger sp. CCB-MM3 TaxID=1792508 RepID=UPI0009F5ECBB|nr:DUF1214 domain-containing protein [Salipiger sp. CCB-MM3]
MKLKAFFGAVAASALLASAGAGLAQSKPGALHEVLEGRTVKIDTSNFIRAATNIEFEKYLALSGGVNTLLHIRDVTSIEQQPTIRMNRDTIYSMALVDISEGATLTLPDAGTRYVSAMVVNQDHYINKVFLGGGSHTLDLATFDTPFVVIVIRTLVDASDPDDLAAAHAVQDAMTLEAGSATPFIVPNYDMENFEEVKQAALALSRFTPDSADTFGAKEDVAPLRHFLGTAFGWGGLPEEEAFYLNVEPGLPVDSYKIEVPADVPVDEFWSVSLYNASGFYQKNAQGAYNINSVSGTRNADESITVHFGGCEDESRVNCLPIMEGWNYSVRLYRPRPEILDGSWQFPDVEPG